MSKSSAYQRRLDIFHEQVTVYPVSCEQLCRGRTDYDWLDAVLAGGAKIVQLRDKVSGDRELLAKAKYFRQKTREAGALFLVNDRLDIGLLAEADGIHVGQDDICPEEIRRVAPDWIIGLSCNSFEHVQTLGRKVASGKSAVSYYNIGPLFETKTKEGLHKFLGVEKVQEFSTHCHLPFTVMGGIKFHHIAELTRVGAGKIAVVTAISMADDMKEETMRWDEAIKSGLRR